MSLLNQLPFRKRTVQTATERSRQIRLRKEFKRKPSTQNSIYFTSQFETGIMHIAENWYSRTYRMGDVAYTTASTEDKLDIIDSYGEALNSLDAGDNFQLLVINRRVDNQTVRKVLYEPAGDCNDIYRDEYNDIIQDRFSFDAKNFKVEKYITLATEAYEKNLADTQLQEMGTLVENELQAMNISLKKLSGIERLGIFNFLLRQQPYFAYTYKDIALSGLAAKNFIVPNRIEFHENFMKIDEQFAKVLYVRDYPNFLSDKLIKSFCDIGIELAVSIHVAPRELGEVGKELSNEQSVAQEEMVRSQKEGFQVGIDPGLAVSGRAVEASETTQKWKDKVNEDQKIFNGVITVYFVADSLEELQQSTKKVQAAGRKLGVDLEETYYHQENGLNTILPIGKPFLEVKKEFMRPFTTSNVVTQVPFTNVDLQSDSQRALYYGQNQLSKNLITLDRQRDLNAANGLIIGTTGSGKGMTTKTTEVIPAYLKYLKDRFIIVDPENEYTDIAEAFGGQVINLSPKSDSHINLMGLTQTDQVLFNENDEEIDSVADKANLLMALFESILKEVTDEDIGIIDRVTKLVYERYSEPTLADWHDILLEQPEDAAQQLATRSEPYAKGSLNLFSYKTNVNLDNRLVVFNLKGLDKKLKPFALLVLQDFIWQQVIKYQGKETIRLYWDELHLTFRNQTDAAFFAELWARIRKYGAIPTGITQNPGTILAWEEGRNLMSNTEFFILLKMREQDIEALRDVVDIPDAMLRYIKRPKEKGSGLILAGETVVPFENKIPKETKLYELTQTDAVVV